MFMYYIECKHVCCLLTCFEFLLKKRDVQVTVEEHWNSRLPPVFVTQFLASLSTLPPLLSMKLLAYILGMPAVLIKIMQKTVYQVSSNLNS